MRGILRCAAAAILIAAPAFAEGGLGVGEKAPLPQAKELINLSSFSPKAAEGKVVLLEVFRTW